MSYKLCSSIVGHKEDVLGLAVTHDDCIVSCSRDKTAKLWRPNKCRGQYTESEVYINDQCLKSKFLTCVCVLPPSDVFKSGLILTGGNDNLILVYEPDCPTSWQQLNGHTNTVCKLVNGTETNTFLSASWDTTVKKWFISNQGTKCLLTIQSHQMSIWAVIQMKSNVIITGSADKIIRVFDIDGKLVRNLTGHEDCVRDLVEIAADEILSCSNDSTIRRWSVSTGECFEILYGHPNFVYSVRMLGDTIISSGEDRCLLLWSKGKHLQTITLPARSIWTIALLSNNDIVTGSSDGVIRIFTVDSERQADENTLAEFAKECANFAVPFKKYLGRSKVSRLPGPETLAESGIREGQTKIIREFSRIVCYSWSLEEKQWKKLGNVDAAGPRIRIVSDNSVQTERKENDEQKDVFICAVCRRTFSRKYVLWKHIKKSDHLIDNEVPPYLKSVLPQTWPYFVCSFRRDQSRFKAEICLPQLNTISDLREWISRFAEMNKCLYHRNATKRGNRGWSTYSEFYRCQHAFPSRKHKKRRSLKATGCKSTIHAAIRRDSDGVACYSRVSLNFRHNHSAEYSQKFKKPSLEVEDHFRTLFKKGLKPTDALRTYKAQLKSQSPEFFEAAIRDRSICPDYSWVRHFYCRVSKNVNGTSKIEFDAEYENSPSSYVDCFEQVEVTNVNPNTELVQLDVVHDNETGSCLSQTKYVLPNIEEMVMEVEVQPEELECNYLTLDKLEECFNEFVDKLEEDTSYYEDGILSMCNELDSICSMPAPCRLFALHSFNKIPENIKSTKDIDDDS